MNIVRFRGGLGNQMFQYALFKRLQQTDGETYMDLSNFQVDTKRNFILDKVFPSISKKEVPTVIWEQLMEKSTDRTLWRKGINKLFPKTRNIFYEEEDGVFDSSVLKQKNKIIDGYWQTEKYWKDIEKIVRQEFIFTQTKDDGLKKCLNLIQQSGCSASIHIRRCDYLEEVGTYGDICTEKYYFDAIDILNRETNCADISYFVFSDDIKWVQENMKIRNSYYIRPVMFDDYQDWYDMLLMSHCKHNIIANSSFSWWAAWLNANKEKCVISPSKWDNRSNTNDIWCKGWHKVNV